MRPWFLGLLQVLMMVSLLAVPASGASCPAPASIAAAKASCCEHGCCCPVRATCAMAPAPTSVPDRDTETVSHKMTESRAVMLYAVLSQPEISVQPVTRVSWSVPASSWLTAGPPQARLRVWLI